MLVVNRGCSRMRNWILSLLVIAGQGAPADEKETNAVADRRQSFERPKVLESKAVRMPLRARLNQLQGTVVVQYTVTMEGKAISPRVTKSSGNDVLDICAAKAVTEWKFSPARRSGKPIVQVVEHEFAFEPPLPSELDELKKQFEKQKPLVVDPRQAEGLFAKRGFRHRAKAKIVFTLDEQGFISWIRLEESSGHVELDYLAVAGAYDEFRVDTKKLSELTPRDSRAAANEQKVKAQFYEKEFVFKP